MTKLLTSHRKWAVTLVAVASQIATLGVFSGAVQHYLLIAIGILGSLGVKQVNNIPSTEGN